MGAVYYVQDGKIINSGKSNAVLVQNANDLPTLADMEPNSVAYTAGFEIVWQKGIDGNWYQIA